LHCIDKNFSPTLAKKVATPTSKIVVKAIKEGLEVRYTNLSGS